MRINANAFDPYVDPPEELEEDQVGWSPEAWDSNLPKRGGFVRDFVYGTRGFEAPTIFSAWTSLFCVSAAVRRSAWMALYPGRIYPNVYVILVAPPSQCKKTTIIEFGADIIRNITKFIPNETLRKIKEVRMLMNKVIPEALIKSLQPLEIHIDGEDESLDLGSQLVIMAPELTVMMGKQSYNTGLIELLTNLYDCPEFWQYTKSSLTETNKVVNIPIRKGFVSFLGGATTDGLARSVPEAAFGDGFMSRLIPVYQDKSTRRFSDTFQPKGAPSGYELARRLSWICLRQVGEFHMNKEAKSYWDKWYDKFCNLRDNDLNDNDPRARFDVVLRKLSLLIRLQRYEEGLEIDLEDLMEAKAILEATYNNSGKATAEVGMSPFMKNVGVAERRIRTAGKRTRRELLTQVRGWRDAYECTRAIQQLHDQGKIRIYRDEKEVQKASNKGTEEYWWTGDMEGRFGR